MTIKQRTETLCQRYEIKPYRLAQLLRIRQDTLKSETEGEAGLRTLFLLAELIGLEPFLILERALGKYSYVKEWREKNFARKE